MTSSSRSCINALTTVVYQNGTRRLQRQRGRRSSSPAILPTPPPRNILGTCLLTMHGFQAWFPGLDFYRLWPIIAHALLVGHWKQSALPHTLDEATKCGKEQSGDALWQNSTKAKTVPSRLSLGIRMRTMTMMISH